MLLRRISPLLRLGIDVVEDGPALANLVGHAVQRSHHGLRMDKAVVRQERADLGQRHVLVIRTVVPGQYPPTEP